MDVIGWNFQNVPNRDLKELMVYVTVAVYR